MKLQWMWCAMEIASEKYHSACGDIKCKKREVRPNVKWMTKCNEETKWMNEWVKLDAWSVCSTLHNELKSFNSTQNFQISFIWLWNEKKNICITYEHIKINAKNYESVENGTFAINVSKNITMKDITQQPTNTQLDRRRIRREDSLL